MRVILPWSILLAVWAAVAAQAQSTNSGDDPGLQPFGRAGKWDLIFHDEFEGSTLNAAVWRTCYWWSEEGCTNQANLDRQWYLSQNVEVSDGVLSLVAKPENVTTPDGISFPYTSGMIASSSYYVDQIVPPRFEFTYGYAEIRTKLPKGRGLFPAFWLQPTGADHYPEIDILEAIGQEITELNNVFHYRNAAGKAFHLGHVTKVPDMSKDWHTYAVQWRPDALIWYFDGKETWRLRDPKIIPNMPMYLLVTLAVGGEWPGDPDSKTKFPARMQVDYIRIWKPRP